VIRIVATDLDGTFWRRDLSVPTAHLRAAEALGEQGVEVIAATSRRRRVVAEHLGRARLEVAAVVLDGAMGVDLRDGTRFHDAAFECAAAVDVLGLFRAHGMEPCLYVDEQDVDVVLAPTPSTCAAHIEYLGSIARTGDLDATVNVPGVYGFSVVGREHEVLAPLATALSEYGAELVLFPEHSYGGWGLVVAPPAVTKWSGVLAYCNQRGVQAHEVLAVGDGDNDVDMLRRAGTAIAVRGGTKRAREVADHLIDPPEMNGWEEILSLVQLGRRTGPGTRRSIHDTGV
jgi:hydroxymethylpyrimidine pyrophosphatase-like HAD family hydrolase